MLCFAFFEIIIALGNVGSGGASYGRIVLNSKLEVEVRFKMPVKTVDVRYLRWSP